MNILKWNGQPITKPGIYANVPLEDYHSPKMCAGPSASSSMLRKLFIQSPAHFYAEWNGNPHRRKPADKESLRVGSAAHHLLLGEDNFGSKYRMRPERYDSWRTDAAKGWKRQQELNGLTVLLPEELERIKGMAHSLAKHPWINPPEKGASRLLEGGIEHSLFWKDEKTGIWLKSRPDAAPSWDGEFSDLKTCRFIGDIDRDIWTYRYDMQAAMQRWGTQAILGIDMRVFYFVFVESDVPHCVDVVTIDEGPIVAAELDLRTALDTFSYCLKTGNWFGPRGTQYDARYAKVSAYKRLEADIHRDVLEQEIRTGDSYAI
jgi:PDDEXK-like domain of unknown function (DUF3799)